MVIGARRLWIPLSLAIGLALAACSDAPRPRVEKPDREPVQRASAPRTPAIPPPASVPADAAPLVIDAGDLAPDEGSSAARGVADAGALPPELIQILQEGPGGPMEEGDDIGIEFEPGGGMEHAAIGVDAPSIVDERMTPSESDVMDAAIREGVLGIAEPGAGEQAPPR